MSTNLVYYPDPILRRPTKPVTDFGPAVLTLAKTMRQVMHDHRGMGLAAPQVGESRQIIIAEFAGVGQTPKSETIPFTVLVNPVITAKSGESEWLHEGCLSIPYVEVGIERARSVVISAQDPTGRPVRLKARGLVARILQHEIDHLNGRLILDYDSDYSSAVNKNDSRPRAIVWGSTQFTIGVLNVIRSSVHVTHIVTEPAKPAGRERTLTPTPVKIYADTVGIGTIEPTDLGDPKVYNFLLSCRPEVMIVAAYGRLIPPALANVTRHPALNLHPSLLPQFRGPTPIQAAILAGKQQTGVTAITLAPHFDAGEIVARAPIKLSGSETFGELEQTLAEAAGTMIVEILPAYLKDELALTAQNELAATSTHKIAAIDRWLDPSAPVELNERKVRAYAPNPGAFVVLAGQPVKILAAHVRAGELVFDRVQPAGKKVMSWADFVRGWRKPLVLESFKPAA